ncbi:MAG TPA: GNAT family protein [Micropepsaceae bacterium]|nr:GNAT family protein [Micropepsaceae bacterium]
MDLYYAAPPKGFWPMQLAVREMAPDEAHLVVDYFYTSTPEYLDGMGVDPSRLMSPDAWRAFLQSEFSLPPGKRQVFFVLWLLDGQPVGFSGCNKIVFGESAFMHLHVSVPEHRQKGIGTECVRRSVDIYFEALRLKRLFCEPNAFNTGPHRTLQKCGFKYLKTYMTVPGAINFHQPVTRWVLER